MNYGNNMNSDLNQGGSKGNKYSNQINNENNDNNMHNKDNNKGNNGNSSSANNQNGSSSNNNNNGMDARSQIICSFHRDFIPDMGDLYKYFGEFGKVTNKIEIEYDSKKVPLAKIKFR